MFRNVIFHKKWRAGLLGNLNGVIVLKQLWEQCPCNISEQSHHRCLTSHKHKWFLAKMSGKISQNPEQNKKKILILFGNKLVVNYYMPIILHGGELSCRGPILLLKVLDLTKYIKYFIYQKHKTNVVQLSLHSLSSLLSQFLERHFRTLTYCMKNTAHFLEIQICKWNILKLYTKCIVMHLNM